MQGVCGCSHPKSGHPSSMRSYSCRPKSGEVCGWARVHDGGQGNRSRGALFARSACSRAFCDLPSQHTIGIGSPCCVWATITIMCVRAAMLSNVELSALLRRVMVCIRESVSIDVVCSVQALGCRECACAGPNVPSKSAIDAQAATASSRARSAIASMAHLCVAVERVF